MRIKISDCILNLMEQLSLNQTEDGSWSFPFETGVSTDCYMIILLRSLEIDDEDLIKELVARIASRQEKNGAWKLFFDENEGNVTATTEAYYAILYSGYYPKDHPRMLAAKIFILANGGLTTTHLFAKIMFALTGQTNWSSLFPLPVEFILLPASFPVNFFSLSVYGRANLAPIMILSTKKYSLRTKKSPDLSDLIINHNEQDFDQWSRSPELRSFFTFIKQGLTNLVGLPEKIHSSAINQAKQYMLNHIEADGMFYSYFSSTFLMIFALLSLEYPKDDPIIKNAINGLKLMKTKINGRTHIQYTTANVWNTSLISYSLQEGGLSPSDPIIIKANQYLRSRQICKFPKKTITNQIILPGGWGFSNLNTMNPDVDDTTASLRAIARNVQNDPTTRLAWEMGIRWLASMQNDDGGWPSFERNKDNCLLTLLPLRQGESILTDPSSADLTGRTLEFFGNFTKLQKNNPIIKRGVDWLVNHQEKDGFWYGGWGVCYLYGTWAAVTGLKACGVSSKHHTIQKAVNWLKTVQNSDGGWGESCKSDIVKTYVPLGVSTLTQTAWALDALITTSNVPTLEIRTGIRYLLNSLEKEGWTTAYPMGQGMAGGFYIHYHSYRYIFPLLALSHYQNKYQKTGAS